MEAFFTQVRNFVESWECLLGAVLQVVGLVVAILLGIGGWMRAYKGIRIAEEERARGEWKHQAYSQFIEALYDLMEAIGRFKNDIKDAFAATSTLSTTQVKGAADRVRPTVRKLSHAIWSFCRCYTSRRIILGRLEAVVEATVDVVRELDDSGRMLLEESYNLPRRRIPPRSRTERLAKVAEAAAGKGEEAWNALWELSWSVQEVYLGHLFDEGLGAMQVRLVRWRENTVFIKYRVKRGRWRRTEWVADASILASAREKGFGDCLELALARLNREWALGKHGRFFVFDAKDLAALQPCSTALNAKFKSGSIIWLPELPWSESK